MTDTHNDNIVVSFKMHTGYDSPLIVVKGENPAQVADRIAALETVGIGAIMGNADAAMRAAYNLGMGLNASPLAHPSTVAANGYKPQDASQGYPVPAPAPQRGSEAPPGQQPPACPHGTKKYVTGNGAKGPWKAWMCPARREDPSKCAPEWVK